MIGVKVDGDVLWLSSIDEKSLDELYELKDKLSDNLAEKNSREGTLGLSNALSAVNSEILTRQRDE